MKSNDTHNDIKRYLSDEMTESERRAFEQRLAEDDFLRESLEGYRSMHAHPDEVNQMKPDALKTGRPTRMLTWSLAAVAASLAVVLLFKLLNTEPGQKYHPEMSDQRLSLNMLTQPVIIRPENDTIREQEDTVNQLTAGSDTGNVPGDDQFLQDSVAPMFTLTPQKIKIARQQPDGRQWKGTSNHLYAYMDGYKVVDYRVDMRQNKSNFTIPRGKQDVNTDDLMHPEARIRYVDFLEQALEKYDAGDYQNALYDFRIILSQYPDDLNAIFYAGMCHYHEGNFNTSIRVMERVVGHDINTFDQDARWHMAMAYKEQAYMDTCLALLTKIAENDAYYGTRADDLLKKLKTLEK